MQLSDAVSIFRSAVFQVLTISGPILLVSMSVGLLISIFQATTSIQEQTISFVPKILAILLMLMFLGPWMFGAMVNYTASLFSQIPAMAR